MVFNQMKTGKYRDVPVVSYNKDINWGLKRFLQIIGKSIIPYAGVIILNVIVMENDVKFDNMDQ